MHENSEHIRNRMLQDAARIWGYPETDAAASFDPLVSLLLSVNAAELERLSGEIHQSRTRVLERLVQLMAPDVLTGPTPASAVMYALSTEDQVQLNAYEQFFFTKRVTAASESEPAKNKDIFFTPTGAFYLNRCAVQYIATGNKLFRYADATTKELMAYSQNQASLSPCTLWVAIDHPEVSLHNTQFFFQIRNEINKTLFYSQLAATRWSIEGKELEVRKGYNTQVTDEGGISAEQLLQQQNGPATRVLQQVNRFFEHCFITLADKQQDTVYKEPILPVELQSIFAPQHLQLLATKPLRWMKIVFPENISNEILEDVSCFSNCIPVVNRRLHDVTYRLQDLMNVLPLTSEDQFFDLGEITDDQGNLLQARDMEKTDRADVNILFRNGGAGRFDERDATAAIQNMIQLLRDEGAAFARLGRDLIAEEIKQLQQVITKLEQLLAQKQVNGEITPYLVMRKRQDTAIRHLFVKYWSTNGMLGNDIKAGTPLLPYKTGAINHAQVYLLTHTYGGRNRLSQVDSVVAYRQAVLSKDRIMSREDIRLFCLQYLGRNVQKIAVNKGVMIAADAAKGFVKTIDITIGLSRKEYLEAMEKNELGYWKEDLAMQLSEKSMAFMPFRIFIEAAA